MNHSFIKIEGVNLRPGSNDGHALRHELHYFCAVSFVAKRVCSLGNDSQISIGDYLRNMIKRNAPTELDASVQTKPLRQLCQIDFLVTAAAAVKVKLGIRHLRSDLSKSLDRNIQSLVPLKAAREDNDEFLIVSGPRRR